MGASTGGPQTLCGPFSSKPAAATFKMPILIVQHMTPGFTTGFRGVAGTYPPAFSRVKDGAKTESPLKAGRAYVAPDDCITSAVHAAPSHQS